jgi:sulfopyruvate decarboxylase subunit beta
VAVSERNSKVVYEALKSCGVRIASALPETWLVHLIRMAEEDPEMTLVRLAKEEEGVGISMGAHFAGVRSALLMQNHGFLQSINGIVSGAMLYKVPLLLLISDRGHMGERDPWQTEGALSGCAPADARPHVGGTGMKRIDCLGAIYDDLSECAVVTIMGAVAVELYSLGHRANFFYLEHAMGIASSIGLGIALAQPQRRVVVIDGDGSVLMNLGTLTTLARYRPPNLTQIVFDNESLLSVGGFPTATSTGSDIAGMAKAAGISDASTVSNVKAFEAAARAGIGSDGIACIVAKVEPVGPASFAMDLHMLENRFEFPRALRQVEPEEAEPPPRPRPRDAGPPTTAPTVKEGT